MKKLNAVAGENDDNNIKKMVLIIFHETCKIIRKLKTKFI